MQLSRRDYLDILDYYNINVKKKDINFLKEKVEKLVANKLCKCIKSVNNKVKNERKSIAICNNSVLKRKSLKIKRFSCKKMKLLSKKNDKNLMKSVKKLTLKNVKKIK